MGSLRVGGRPWLAVFVAVAVTLAVILAPVATANVAVPRKAPDSGRTQRAADAQGTFYTAGARLLAWWDGQEDAAAALTRLGDVQQCPESVDTRVDSELLVPHDALLASCRLDASGYNLTASLSASGSLEPPSKTQTAALCLSEACTTWLVHVTTASWLPECHYRQSDTSLRSLAETLLLVWEDLTAGPSATGPFNAPNSSEFLLLYQFKQLQNVVQGQTKTPTPVMQVSRRLQRNKSVSTSSTASTDSTGASGVVVDVKLGSSHGNGSTSSAGEADAEVGATDGSSQSASAESSVSDNDDIASIGSSGEGPHAASTSTTTVLTTAYVYVTLSWLLFNGSYLFLMRKK